MNPERRIPAEAAAALAAAPMVETKDRYQANCYAAYLYAKGYTQQSIGDARGVTRQAISIAIEGKPVGLPSGWPAVPKVPHRRGPRTAPSLKRTQKHRLTQMFLLSKQHRHQHAQDSPWALASRQFLAEVHALQEEQGYTTADIAHDLDVPVGALYKRLRDAKRREAS